MSEELEYLRGVIDALVKSIDRVEDKVQSGHERLEQKVDEIRESQASQKANMASMATKIATHDKLLVLGNGQRPLTVQVAEIRSDIDTIKKAPIPTDPEDIVRAKWISRGKFVTFVLIVVSQAVVFLYGGSLPSF